MASIQQDHVATDGTPPEPEVAPTGASTSAWRILAALAVVVCVSVNAYVVWGTRFPAFPFDEVSVLQMSRLIVGEAIPDSIRGAGYFPGWSVLIAPIWWFTSDPITAYRAALWIGVAVSVVTIWPLAQIVRRFGLTGAQATVVGAFVMAMPARAAQSDFAMSERLLTLLLVLSVLAAFRLSERPSVVRHLVFAGALGLLHFTHVRMSVVLIAAAVWLLLRLPRHVSASAAGLAMIAFSWWAASTAGRAMNEALLGKAFSQGDDLMERLTNSRPSLFLRVGVGQSWYQSLASYGLIAFGLILVVVVVWREVRRGRFEAMTFVFGTTCAMVLLSLIQWANDYSLFDNPFVRLDVWIYGRYIDPVAPVLIALGLASVIRGVSRTTTWWAIGLNVIAAVSAFALLTREIPTWGFVTPAHVPGLLPWSSLLPTEPWPRDQWIVPTLTNENRIWIIAPACVLAVLLGIAAARRRPFLIASALVLVAAIGTIASDPATDDFHEQEGTAAAMRPQVRQLVDLTSETQIGYSRDCGARDGLDGPGQNYLGYAMLPAPLQSVFDEDDITNDMDIVLACDVWPLGERLGARPVGGPSTFASRIWIMPGELQDRAAASGRLAP